jgi:hypothetical protein
MKNKEVGKGTSVPPSKEHVMIYFLQKNATYSEAVNFYQYFQRKKWKNNRSKRISNWKIAAWNWILDVKYGTMLSQSENFGKSLSQINTARGDTPVAETHC